MWRLSLLGGKAVVVIARSIFHESLQLLLFAVMCDSGKACRAGQQTHERHIDK